MAQTPASGRRSRDRWEQICHYKQVFSFETLGWAPHFSPGFI
jgi:hypothetical protein